jgi:hypothetical protein
VSGLIKRLISSIKNKKPGNNLGIPNKLIIPNMYNVPIHDQGAESSCTSHAVAAAVELVLSEMLGERALIDVDDLWDKQKMYGTATENGDSVTVAIEIASKYGLLFETESGKKGIFKTDTGIEFFEQQA